MNKKASCLFYTHVYVKCTLQITNIIITTILFDNFFPSPMLQEHLEHQQTYACSTVQYNHKGLPNCAKQKLTRPGELVQAQTGILVSLNSTANKMGLSFHIFHKHFSWEALVHHTAKVTGREVNIVKP